MSIRLSLPFAFALALAFQTHFATAQAPASSPQPPLDKAAIEAIVRNYLVKNPEVIQEALNELDKRMLEQQATALKEMVLRHKDVLFHSKNNAVVGNPNGKVTLVEFFDYNCGYCRRAFDDVQKLMADEPELKVVLKEFPVLGVSSKEAHALAAGILVVAPDKYLDFHRRVYAVKGEITKQKVLAVIKDMGVNVSAVEKAAAAPEGELIVNEARDVALALGLNGTPTFIIGDEVIVGYPGYDQLKSKILAIKNTVR